MSETSEGLPQRRRHRLAPEAYASTEHEFHFTICARHQGSPFKDPSLAKTVIDSLLWTRERYRWVLFCYYLMPDHLHFVCRLTERDAKLLNAGARGVLPEGVLEHIGRFKRFTTHESWKTGVRGNLWQKSSYDRLLDLPHPLERVVEYILDNPVRKQLVSEWTQWPYSAIVDEWS